MDFSEYIKIFTTILAIINPISTIPYFLKFTENDITKRPQVAKQATITVFAIMAVFVFLGIQILNFFSITIDGFRIAGGLLLLYLAFNMLFAKKQVRHTEEENKEATEKEDSVAIVPLAIPLLAGPGTISTIILLTTRMESFLDKLILLSACFLVTIVVWMSFKMAPQISKAVGVTGMNIIKRIMGLILASIAVEFVINGLRNALPGLAG